MNAADLHTLYRLIIPLWASVLWTAILGGTTGYILAYIARRILRPVRHQAWLYIASMFFCCLAYFVVIETMNRALIYALADCAQTNSCRLSRYERGFQVTFDQPTLGGETLYIRENRLPSVNQHLISQGWQPLTPSRVISK
jgi:hypothetical protein